MSGTIVNLRRARKAKARSDQAATASANRARHGMTRLERQALWAADAKAVRHLDAHRLMPKQDDDG